MHFPFPSFVVTLIAKHHVCITFYRFTFLLVSWMWLCSERWRVFALDVVHIGKCCFRIWLDMRMTNETNDSSAYKTTKVKDKTNKLIAHRRQTPIWKSPKILRRTWRKSSVEESGQKQSMRWSSKKERKRGRCLAKYHRKRCELWACPIISFVNVESTHGKWSLWKCNSKKRQRFLSQHSNVQNVLIVVSSLVGRWFIHRTRCARQWWPSAPERSLLTKFWLKVYGL